MPGRWINVAWVVVLSGVWVAGSTRATAQGTENGEWRSYGGDIANTRYSPLDQINGDNFRKALH